MKLGEYKQQLKFMDFICNSVKDLEYSDLNTLEQPRKELHREYLIPMMNKEYENMINCLKDIEDYLKQIGVKNPDEIDIDYYFEDPNGYDNFKRDFEDKFDSNESNFSFYG